MCRKAKFVGSLLVVGKTDADALLLREKVSVSEPSDCTSPYFLKFRSAERLTHVNIFLYR